MVGAFVFESPLQSSSNIAYTSGPSGGPRLWLTMESCPIVPRSTMGPVQQPASGVTSTRVYQHPYNSAPCVSTNVPHSGLQISIINLFLLTKSRGHYAWISFLKFQMEICASFKCKWQWQCKVIGSEKFYMKIFGTLLKIFWESLVCLCS